jgi:signal transduction histidine kinase
VLVNDADAAPGELAGRIREQAALMRHQVNYHLDRARAAALVDTLGTLTEAAPVVGGLVRTFAKIYRDKDLTIETFMAAGARFRGERQDLEEMIGNLIDNACKWAASHVVIRTTVAHEAGRGLLRIAIEDDGPGLPEAARATMLERGRRLDETKPGSGLGLSIVAELVALYRGSIRLEQATLGGLRVALELPGDGG